MVFGDGHLPIGTAESVAGVASVGSAVAGRAQVAHTQRAVAQLVIICEQTRVERDAHLILTPENRRFRIAADLTPYLHATIGQHCYLKQRQKYIVSASAPPLVGVQH